MLRILSIAFAMAIVCADASAQDNAPSGGASRYSFNRVNDEFLRLDNQTGQVTLCNARTVGWACEVVPEDRAALDKEIGRLQNEVSALKRELAALKAPTDKSGEVKLTMPSKEDIARARIFIEDTWRNLVDMLSTMQKDMMRKG